MIRSISLLIFICLNLVSFAQNEAVETFKNDSLLILKQNFETTDSIDVH